ncbi:MAG: HAMP domain-containing histidine kinase [Sphingobacteriia bacterium]|nr:HAMP domain-containing histidine kinase [Sphingobacteriia bacterium]
MNKIFKNIYNFCYIKTQVIKPQFHGFSVYGLISYVFACITGAEYCCDIYTLLGLTIYFLMYFKEELWPQKLEKYHCVYWYFALLYCLPFLSTYLIYNYNAKLDTIIGNALSLFMLAILTDWLSYIILLVLGFSIALLIYLNKIGFNINVHDLIYTEQCFVIIYSYIISFVIVTFFSRNRYLIEQEKINHFKFVSSILSHELNTPIASLKALNNAIDENLPVFLDAYEKAKEMGIPVKRISDTKYKSLIKTINNVNNTLKKINNINEIFRVKLNDTLEEKKFNKVKIQDCISNALKDYHFSRSEKHKIKWIQDYNFEFKGDEILIKHVLFNLIKNALHFSTEKSFIEIKCKKEVNKNILVFRDTGKGIAADILPYIFERFFTKTEYGAGIGLSFSQLVMRKIGGEIICASEEGRYTEFKLIFPEIN